MQRDLGEMRSGRNAANGPSGACGTWFFARFTGRSRGFPDRRAMGLAGQAETVDLTLSAFAFAFFSAFFYMAATFAMKYWSGQSLLVVVVPAGAALLLAAMFEIEALRKAQMARTLIVIISFEVLLTLICAVVLLNEHYSMRDLIAVALMLTGTVLLIYREEDATRPSAAAELAMTMASRQKEVASDAAEPSGRFCPPHSRRG
jgi:drug/metabolite transporter (DMT)-like permease